MKEKIVVPQAGESITEVTIAEIRKKSGEGIQKDEVLLVIETDKASLDIVSEFSGKVDLKVNEGDVVKVGALLAEIDTAAATTASAPKAAPTNGSGNGAHHAPAGASAALSAHPLSPAVRKIVTETKIDPATLAGSGRGGRVTKGDVLAALETPVAVPMGAPSMDKPAAAAPIKRPEIHFGDSDDKVWREPMTTVRKAIAKNLVQSQHTNAILSTFNEIDMFNVQRLRADYKEKFKERYGINLGFMGFFVRAACQALQEFPKVNAVIDGEDIVYKNFANIGVAVSTKKGLMVPVIKHADKMGLADIEKTIRYFAEAGQAGKISIDDMSGGTFTITNGGTFGSMMSTPIINPGQSGILGLHKIEDRPVALNGQVVIRPMMYVTLSYDHRLIDGSESVRFLVRVKECIEDPARLLIGI